jgi:quinolinate synthase
MKLNSLEKIYTALKYEQPELLMSDELIIKSRKPIEKMLKLSAEFGL